MLISMADSQGKNHRSFQTDRTDDIQRKRHLSDGKPLIRDNRYQMTIRNSKMLRMLIVTSDGTK